MKIEVDADIIDLAKSIADGGAHHAFEMDETHPQDVIELIRHIDLEFQDVEFSMKLLETLAKSLSFSIGEKAVIEGLKSRLEGKN